MNEGFVSRIKYTPIELDLPELKALEVSNGRVYVTPSGRHLPSVTTVTGFEEKDGYAIWRRKNPQEAQRVVERGNRIHSMMEHFLKGEQVELTENERIDSLYHMMRSHVENYIENVYALETHLWSEEIGLAGRVDCICDYDGILSVVDFKGSTRNKRESDIKHYFLQATAYALIFQEITKRPVGQIVIVVASEDGKIQEFRKKPIDHVNGLLRAIRLYDQWYQLNPTTPVFPLAE